MTETLVAQRNLLCVNCAGQCAYVPSTGTLTCQSCGTAHDIPVDPDADPSEEQHYHPDMPHTEQPEFSQERSHQCQTCGGSVVFHGFSISENCPYCDGVLVDQSHEESYPIVGMIPFSVESEQAQVNVQDWVSGRWAAPSDLGGIVSQGRVSGIYVPFWTFDSDEAVEYTVKYRVKSGDKTVSRSVSGKMNTTFDDMLMPASPHVTPLIRDGILHDFRPESLRPPEPAYLAGFAAERHHQSVREGLKHNEKDKALLLRNRIKKHSRKSRVYHVSYVTDTTGIKYRRILLPVWIMHYQYGGKAMKVVTCGLHGRTFGERPFSTIKLLGLAAALSVASAALGFIWGALGIY